MMKVIANSAGLLNYLKYIDLEESWVTGAQDRTQFSIVILREM